MPEIRMLDGNEAAALVAYLASDVVAIYPITPASPMGEFADQWASEGKPNAWGSVPTVVEMQSEGGAAGAVHGALMAGAAATTFTASQGLLLMIPNMYKIAGELTPLVIHVAARALATQGLSIFGDHSDVMAARGTGFAMLASGSPQEAMDLALVAHAATLEGRIPFLHFFDGFRTSHEIARVEPLGVADVRALLEEGPRAAHFARALSPDHPTVRGTAQNPDAFFQAREAGNPWYLACPGIVQRAMDRLGERTGRFYQLAEYAGSPDADRIIVLMGSGAEVAHETVDALARTGEKVGIVKLRLFRPFPVDALLEALPPTTRKIAVLDRTKEPGSAGEPLYQDVVTAVAEGMAGHDAPFARMPLIVGGRYGLGSKEFTPAMVKGVFDHLAGSAPANHFTVGIIDDVTHTSIGWHPSWSTEDPATTRAVFYGLGSDGTVGGNKNAIKIIGEEAGLFAQGYFVYDSKKSGSVTVSHLRFGTRPIRSSYLITRANFVAVHQFHLLDRIEMLAVAEPGATVLLNSPYPADQVWRHLPARVQKEIVERKLKLFSVDALGVAREAGLLCPDQPAAPPRGGRRDQARHREELRQAGRSRGGEELGGGRQGRRRAPGSHRSRQGHQPDPDAPAGAGGRAGVRPAGFRPSHRRRGRRPSRLHDSRRWMLAGRHHPVGEARPRGRSAGVGPIDLHPVRQVRAGLSPRGDPVGGVRP
jgi:pyruvate-ferredoxin/flavodoxin oxidoreductase